MEVNDLYYDKYLKYKIKYLNLQSQNRWKNFKCCNSIIF